MRTLTHTAGAFRLYDRGPRPVAGLIPGPIAVGWRPILLGVKVVELSPEDLHRMHERYPYPSFSNDEYQRRYANIRRMMREQDVDCLLIIGGSAAYGRLWSNFRYVSNMVGKADQAKYVIFPLEDAPRVVVSGHAAAPAMLARSVLRHALPPKPSTLEAVVRAVEEVGCSAAKLGIVEYDTVTSIPKNHWDFLTSRLPKANFKFVTREFLALRLIKSVEEIECLRCSSNLNDIAVMAIANRVRPGMTEAQAFAYGYEAAVAAGGELGMLQVSSSPMDDPDLNDPRPRPISRLIGHRDFLNNEIGIFYNGYEAQTGKPMSMGPPVAALKDLFKVTQQAYHAVAATLVPGKSSQDSIQAAQCIRQAGYESYGPFVQGMYGYDPRYEPEFDFPDLRTGQGDLTYEEGMVFVVQPHVRDIDGTMSLFLGDTFVIEKGGPRCLNRVPPEWIEI